MRMFMTVMFRPDILYSDKAMLVLSKPPGTAVHDAPGPGRSLLRALRLEQGPELTPVHRLDKDSSGVLILARSKEIAARLQKNWHLAKKTYWALCEGIPPNQCGVIDEPILENQTGKPERLKSALRYYQLKHPNSVLPPIPEPKTSAVHPAGRFSQTAYRVIEKFNCSQSRWSWLEVQPQQGRMHQIRVHLAQLGHPLAADPLYGRRECLCASDFGANGSGILQRMPLHAAELTFIHPIDQKREMTVKAPLPEDLFSILKLLRQCVVL